MRPRPCARPSSQPHIAPTGLSLGEWIEEWLALKGRSLKARTHERYSQLLKLHIVPTLGDRPLQGLTSRDIDKLYGGLGLAPGSQVLLHVVLKACLGSAVRKRLLPHNPVEDAEKPRGSDEEAVTVLDEDQLGQLVQAFKGRALYPIVATAALTGMRRNEILALRWQDVDLDKRTITVRWNLEETKAFGRRVVTPKSKRGFRTFEIDHDLAALLRSERPSVDVSLMPEALVFPCPGSLTQQRAAKCTGARFMAQAKALGFPIRFHDLRASHEVALLDRGVPVHVVAARCGHDPAMLKVYAKRTKKADKSAAIGALGLLGPKLGPVLVSSGSTD
jgi:integrase